MFSNRHITNCTQFRWSSRIGSPAFTIIEQFQINVAKYGEEAFVIGFWVSTAIILICVSTAIFVSYNFTVRIESSEFGLTISAGEKDECHLANHVVAVTCQLAADHFIHSYAQNICQCV